MERHIEKLTYIEVGKLIDKSIDNGFKKAIVINGHGGHLNELKEVAIDVCSESNLMTVMFHWWIAMEQFTKDFFKVQGGHAAVDETAMILATDENLVKEKLYTEVASARLSRIRFT